MKKCNKVQELLNHAAECGECARNLFIVAILAHEHADNTPIYQTLKRHVAAIVNSARRI